MICALLRDHTMMPRHWQHLQECPQHLASTCSLNTSQPLGTSLQAAEVGLIKTCTHHGTPIGAHTLGGTPKREIMTSWNPLTSYSYLESRDVAKRVGHVFECSCITFSTFLTFLMFNCFFCFYLFVRSLVSCVILMYLPCFMLVYSIYCIVVSSLLFNPPVDKPCTGNMSSAPPASISL